MNDNSDIVRSIFGVHKIKYKILDDLDIGKVNAFHINLTTILNYAIKHYPDLSNEKDYLYIIVSQIVNLVAHYRHYFIKNKYDPDIYIYGWNDNFKNTLKLLKVIIQYIPRVYYIKTKDIPISSAIFYVADKKYKNNLVLTKSKMDVLLVNNKINVLKSNKDKSILYTQEDVFNKFSKRDYSKISWKLLPVFYALSGLSGDRIKGYSPAKVLRLLSSAIESHNIVNEYYYDIDHFLSDMEDLISLDGNELNIFKDNFKNSNVVSKYKKYMTPVVREIIDNSIIDKFAKNDIKELNIKYFTGLDSLMLEELFEQLHQDKRTIRW